MVEKGATTIWELWNGDTADPAMNSGNHVMQIGDLAVWMYEYLAGIRSDPAEARLPATSIIRPYPAGDLTFVKAIAPDRCTARWPVPGSATTARSRST